MQVIIVGCGRVGKSLARQLQEEEDIELVLVDNSADHLQSIADELDAMTIVGNGSDIEVLTEAGIKECDLLIAVTNSDELNILCCLFAQSFGDVATVARVRSPIYHRSVDFFKNHLGINLIINPEYASALEICKLHTRPTAMKVDSFSRDRMQLLKFRVPTQLGFDGITVLDVMKKLHRLDILICGIENKNGVIIPGGSDIVHDGDFLYILCPRQTASELFSRLGIKENRVRSTMIIGGGTTAYYLATKLLEMNINVKIIEKNKDRCEELSDLVPNATIINGDGTDRALLQEEGLESTGSLVCLTNMDEENIFLALYGKKQNPNGKMVARVTKLDFDDVLEDLNIDTLIYPKYLTADYILSYVRALKNASGSNVETLYHIMDGQAEALEFVIRDNSSILDTPLSELHLKSNTLVGCITRGKKIMIPRGQDTIQIGDTVIIVTTHKGLKDISEILA